MDELNLYELDQDEVATENFSPGNDPGAQTFSYFFGEDDTADPKDDTKNSYFESDI